MSREFWSEHPFRVFFMAVALVIVGAAFIFDHVIDRIDDAAAVAKRSAVAGNQEQVERQVQACIDGNNSRKATQGILDDAVDQGETAITSLDFSLVEPYDQLDPNLQLYLTNLGMYLNSGNGPDLDVIAENFRRTNPQRDCEDLRAELEEKLLVEE